MAEPRVDWHATSRTAVLAELGSGGEGLTAEEAQSRLARAGPNRLPEATGPSAGRLLLAQVRSPLILALVAAGALALALGEWEDGAVVLAVVVLNTLIGFGQDYRAGQAIAALSVLVAEPARVKRDGTWIAVPAEEVVTGDVLEVAQGERVVADLRLLDAASLRAEEAALTGESEPVDKGVGAVSAGTPLAERSSLLYAGTLVAAGSGRGVAVATGSGTELGRISAMIGAVESLETPLTRDLDRFGRTVTGAIAALAVAVAGIAAARGFAVVEAAMAGISLAVAAVPEGLPTVVTIALAVGARRMAARRAIVRRLPAVETLGAATVVASDKTGTLTRNRMRVEAIWAPAGDTTELRGSTVYVKGAPEAVLPLCRDGEAVAAEVDRQTALGRRVLVFAARDEAVDVAPVGDLRILGLQALVDPPRDGAREAVAACREAGVRVVMVTGDHPRTARAIGASLGIAPEDVHARVAPEGKLRLVRDLQAAGEVVAVTGDGVNDPPALRQADIGVAMGQGGTAAAREAADMVLADDDISTLRAAIEEGRRAYDNLVKALALALPLAFEAPEPDVMRRPPRRPGAPLLDRAMIVRTLLVSATLTAVALGLFELARHDGASLARAQTTAVTGAVILQAFYLLACRSLTRPNRELGRWSNPAVYAGIAVVAALQALYVFAAFMQEVFGSAALDAEQLAWATAAAVTVLPVAGAEEWLRRRSAREQRR